MVPGSLVMVVVLVLTLLAMAVALLGGLVVVGVGEGGGGDRCGAGDQGQQQRRDPPAAGKTELHGGIRPAVRERGAGHGWTVSSCQGLSSSNGHNPRSPSFRW